QRHFFRHPVDLLLALPEFIGPGIFEGLVLIAGFGKGHGGFLRTGAKWRGGASNERAVRSRRSHQIRRRTMTDTGKISEHMEIIGADGVHVGTVDKVEGDRIKLTKKDGGEGSHRGHHHFISTGLVAGVEGDKVRLSANAAVAVTFEEER